MNYPELDILEERINRAVEQMTKLTNENRELRQQNSELLAKIEDNERTIRKLKDEYQNLAQLQEEAQTFREKEQTIKMKVEGILSKLDELQFGS